MPLDPASIALIVSRQKAAGWVQTVRGGLGVPDGTYRVGARGQLQRANLGADRGNFFFSPDEVKNEQEQVNRLVDSLGVDVNAQQARLPKRVVAGFSQFWSEWKAFYNANNGFLARHERGTYEKTLEYRAQASNWQKQIKKAGGETTALELLHTSQPGEDNQGKDDKIKKTLVYVGIGTLGLVTLFVLAKLVHTAVLGSAALGEAEMTAMALADAAKRKRSNRHVVTIT